MSDLLVAVTQRLAFDGSAAGKGLREKRDHHRFDALELGEGVGLAV